jgi:hypothetical protein
MKESIAIVACSYHLSASDTAARLRQLLPEGATVRASFIVAASAVETQDLGHGWKVIPTDNLDFDFSAYLTGAAMVADQASGATAIIFLNDTLFTDHAAEANFRALWRQMGLIQAIQMPAISGKADQYTTVCLRNPWSGLGQYISSYCFALNPPALALMLRLREWAEQDDVTHEPAVDSPAWGAKLPGAFKEFLRANLIYRRSPYLWYRLAGTAFSPAQLTSKARCIYFEHRLSGAIAEAGCMLPTNAGPRWSFYLSTHERLSRFRRRLGL